MLIFKYKIYAFGYQKMNIDAPWKPNGNFSLKKLRAQAGREVTLKASIRVPALISCPVLTLRNTKTFFHLWCYMF